ncbi:MAG: hypothetical protein WKF96_22700 [Solirubrobacteraceae bacterium]
MTVRVALVAVAVPALLAPASASAATCSDHATQAAAQRAADTGRRAWLCVAELIVGRIRVPVAPGRCG